MLKPPTTLFIQLTLRTITNAVQACGPNRSTIDLDVSNDIAIKEVNVVTVIRATV